ncbi:UNVERIFIED_CONTAM: hypothetical protein RMT77_010839 [Armadillidium vulgare]
MGSTDVLCPVCAEPCSDLPHHLESHSKEEIIQSLSSNRSCHDNLPDRSFSQNIESSDNKRVANVDISSVNGGNNTSSGSSFTETSSFSSSSLYCGTNLLNKASLLPVVKNITNGNNVVSSNTQIASSSFLQNGSCVSQFAPQAYVVYQQPNNVYQNIDGNNSVNTPGLIQSYNQSSVLNSQTIRPSLVNQQVAQTEVIMAQANSRVVNNSNLESRPHFKINSDVSSVAVNSFPGTSFLSNNVAVPNNNGSQHVFCLLPYSQVQPSLPAGGNFVMYNNLVHGSNAVSDVLQQQCGVNYFVGGNNPNMSLNNSSVPNQMYYLPSNLGTNGARQDGSQYPLQPQNVIVNKNASQLAAPLLPLSATGSPSLAPLNTTPAIKSVLRVANDSENNTADKTLGTDVTTLKIGDNIKISLPKDIAEKKDRLKELINRELCRAILLNDSGELGSKCIENGENADRLNSIEKREIKANCLLKPPSNSDVKCNNEKDLGNKESSCIDFQENNNSLDSPLPDSNPVYTLDSPFKLLQGSISDTRNLRNNFKFGDSSFSSVFPKIFADNISNEKSPVKLENELSAPGVSGIKQNTSVNSSTSLLLPTKNLNFLDFSDMGYGGDHELGAIEEVLAGENMISTSLDCKPCEPSSAKLVNSFSSDNSIDNSENLYCSSNIDSELETSLKDRFLSPKKIDRYAKTYFRARKATKSVVDKGNIPNSNKKSSFDDKPQVITDPTQINLKIQNLSEQIDEEMIDDPLYDDVENSSISNEIFMNDLPKNQVLENESSLPEESKGYLSVYQGIPMKLETGESNGTLAEEVLSLKASETLADSDSERATPNEEVTEMYYGKSCIFAGEPGPANLSSQRYAPIEPLELLSHSQHEEQSFENESSQESQSLPTQMTVDLSVNSVRTHGETPEEDTISLILDANCSIVPADTVQHLPHLLDHNQGSSFNIFQGSFLKKENCSEELSRQQFSNFPEDSKAFVTTGLVDKCLIPVSPHASTSGLQNIEKNIGLVKKACIEDEDYDFEYESDGYGDSDFSDSAHQQKSGSMDLEKWRCNRCNKTFKSLKEKLLHSGHHSPCSLGGKSSSPDEDDLVVENSWDCQKDVKNSKSGILKEENVDNKLSSSEKIQKLSVKKNSSTKGKKRTVLNKIKPEEGNTDVLAESTSVSSASAVGSEGEFSCTECSRTFPTLDKLYEHRKTALKSRYMCPVCHIEFQNRIDKLRHIKTHPTSDFMCSICHRSFDNFYLWSKHQLFHMGLIFYECKECGYKCQRKGELKIHYRKHSGEKPYSCETCLRSFVSNQSLKRHLLVHMVGQEVECEVCFKRYKNGLVLTKHKLKMHSKKKMFVKKRTDFICDICNEIFRSEKKLTWHQETHKRWPKKCQTCGECFIHQANLTKHIRRKHDANYMPPGTDKESTVCPVCKKVYKRSSLPLHMRIHNGVKPYKCNVCSKEFTVKCNFDSHKWTHTGTRDRPYKCKLCDRSYHLHGLLDMHIRSHKKIRPYTCNECGKSFIRKNNYQTHKALHTGEKQHECKFCGKTFFRKYNLNNHVRIHTGETPYECTICRKEFAQKSNYNVHMKAFHVERHAIHEEV